MGTSSRTRNPPRPKWRATACPPMVSTLTKAWNVLSTCPFCPILQRLHPGGCPGVIAAPFPASSPSLSLAFSLTYLALTSHPPLLIPSGRVPDLFGALGSPYGLLRPVRRRRAHLKGGGPGGQGNTRWSAHEHQHGRSAGLCSPPESDRLPRVCRT